jgi:hypothetical protein
VPALCHSPEILKFQLHCCKNRISHNVNNVSLTLMSYSDTGNGEGKVVPVHSMKVYGGVKHLIEVSGQL